MKIAVCDDDTTQTKLLSTFISKWSEMNKIPVKIEAFDRAEAFYFAWCEDKSYDALLLDIQMPGQNGMELARKIRKTDETLSIIFVTGFSDYIYEGYDVSALHYLMKPVKEEKLFACLDKACKKVKTEIKSLLVACGGENVRILQSEIVYVEAFAHSVVIHTSGDSFETAVSLSEIENMLDVKQFFRPHRSYIVGMRYIRQIAKTVLILDSGVQIPVSRRRYNDMNKTFIAFYRGETD